VRLDGARNCDGEIFCHNSRQIRSARAEPERRPALIPERAVAGHWPPAFTGIFNPNRRLRDYLTGADFHPQ
jgi:hypothetical protein